MSFRELSEWDVFLNTHPPDGEVLDWQFATLMAVLSSVFGKRSDPATWSLFERMRPKTVEEISRALKRQFGIEA